MSAAITAAVVVGGAAIYAASQTAGATTAAANTAAGVQEQALQQQATLAAPYTGLGQSAIPKLESLLGLTGNPGTTLASLEATPGYQFTKQQGIQGVENAAASSGMLLSGNTLKGVADYTTGLADQTYQQQVQDDLSAVGIGQAAAAGQASNIQAGANNISNIRTNQGNTLASIDANTIAGVTGAIGNGMSNYLTLQTLQGLNNPGTTSSDQVVQGAWNDYAAGTGYAIG